MKEVFDLTEQHIALIKRMNVQWEDSAYDGAPAIDIKRPYGNSSVWRDVAEILGIKKIEDDNGETYWPKGTQEACLDLHRETETALQVCLAAQSFVPGRYVADKYLDNWSLETR